MTQVTEDQKYGMIESIIHLINRDYSEIGQDFINLGFIPKGTDTRPIVPALTKVFYAALAGGGAKSINFQELAADLATITYSFPFTIPAYFALIIRAISGKSRLLSRLIALSLYQMLTPSFSSRRYCFGR